MRIAELFGRGRPVFSFEFFPPKTDEAASSMLATVRDLGEMLQPDFVSVTCPLDKPRRPLTFELVARIQRELGLTAMAHLVTVLYAREEVLRVFEQLRREGIENVLALRGDLPAEGREKALLDFAHASDLAGYAREHGFSVGGAAHPEMHPDSREWGGEMLGARSKVDALSGGAQGVAMIRTILNLAFNLGVDVIAEGIETPAQADQLLRLGCLHGQGYLFSRPVRPTRVLEMLAEKAAAPTDPAAT